MGDIPGTVPPRLEQPVPFTNYLTRLYFQSDRTLGARPRGTFLAVRVPIREEQGIRNLRAPAGIGNLKVISWNLLHGTGAGVEDVAALVERHRPDILLLQEATEELAALPAIIGGSFFREPLDGRNYGLAVWSPRPLPPPYALRLPVSSVPGRVPPRVAQIAQLGNVAFANVHLSHGQFLNRRQLLRIASVLKGPAAIVGDYNAVGPIKLAGFKDIGPRRPTHIASNIISFRLDRCMARGLRCSHARVLARGPSDHYPIARPARRIGRCASLGRKPYCGRPAPDPECEKMASCIIRCT